MIWFPECDNDPTGEALKKQQQTLTFYELDLGLNHVVRKYAEPLADPGNLLIPGAFEGKKPWLFRNYHFLETMKLTFEQI